MVRIMQSGKQRNQKKVYISIYFWMKAKKAGGKYRSTLCMSNAKEAAGKYRSTLCNKETTKFVSKIHINDFRPCHLTPCLQTVDTCS